MNNQKRNREEELDSFKENIAQVIREHIMMISMPVSKAIINNNLDYANRQLLLLAQKNVLELSDKVESLFSVAKEKIEQIEFDEEKIITENTLLEKGDIFILEDDKEMGEFLKYLFYDNGYKATVFTSAEVLYKRLSVLEPNIVLCHITHLEEERFNLIEKIKSTKQWGNIATTILDSSIGNENKIRAFKSDIDGYIGLPFDEKELIAFVDYIYRKQQNYSKSSNIDINEEEKWLKDVKKFIYDNLSNTNFKLNVLAQEMNLSERQLQRKLKNITNKSPYDLINEIKMEEAKKRIISGDIKSIKTLAYNLGYNHPEYFSTQFKNHFGRTATSYLKNKLDT